jgi:membrane dipeptidase
MTMKRSLLLFALMTATAAAQASAESQDLKITPRARAIHDSAIIVDTHADTTQYFAHPDFDLADASERIGAHFDLKTAKAGNIGAEFFVAWVDCEKYKGREARRTLELIDAIQQEVKQHPNDAVLALTADDIVRARTGPRKKLAALIGIEGGHSIENSLSLLRDYYRLGARYMTLTHSCSLDWARSSGDEKEETKKTGLSDFGREVVREMNRLGMMVDISHVNDRTFYHALLVSRAPVIASHSSARALNSHLRNMTDDMLRAVANNGGVVMVNFYSGFIDENYRKASTDMREARTAALKELEKQWEGKTDTPEYYLVRDRAARQWAAKIRRPSLKILIDHFDHIAKVAGIDHVGLGSDFDGIDSLPAGIDTAADLPKITQALLDRGYTRAQIHKVLGGNFLRVMRRVEQVARELRAEKEDPATIKKEIKGPGKP